MGSVARSGPLARSAERAIIVAMMRRSQLGVAACVVVALSIGCAAILRYPRQQETPGLDEVAGLQRTMNLDFLTGSRFDRLIVEIDWYEGDPPTRETIDAIGSTLRAYAPDGYEVVVELDDEIAAEVWAEDSRAAPTAFSAAHLDRVPDPTSRINALYVVFQPELPDGGPANMGFMANINGDWENAAGQMIHARQMPVIVIGKRNVRKRAVAWLSEGEVERMVIVHEIGHFIGLVSNPSHMNRHGPHCTNPQCAMQKGTWRAVLANFGPAFFMGRLPWHFDADCERDIALVRQSVGAVPGAPLVSHAAAGPNHETER